MDTAPKKVIMAALIGNALVALTKFLAAFFTGSSAMLSEGIHSVVDTGNQVLLLHGLEQSKKPADDQYPFGHGKEVYFWSFVVAILIFALGAGISIYEGVLHLIDPNPVESPFVNYVVLLLALGFEGAAWYFALTEFTRTKGKRSYLTAVRQSKDPSIFLVLFEDSAAVLGLLVAFLGILLGHITGSPYYDGMASIIIGLILAGTAVWLSYETKGLLIGESANREIVKGIRACAGAFEGIEHVNEVLTMHMGPQFVLATLSVDFDDSVTAGDMEKTIAEIDARIKEAHPVVKRIFIEAESRKRWVPGV